MSLQAEVIQTGSSGNCVVLEGIIALDMGIPFYKILPFMSRLQVVLIGHEHSDHFKESTVKRLIQARPSLRFLGGEFMVEKFLRAGVPRRNIDILRPGNLYDYRQYIIEPVELHHDVPCYGFKIWINGPRGGSACYFVDTGNLEGIEAPGFDLYLVEANYRELGIEERIRQKTAAGEFSYEVRARENHLSYEQTIEWLSDNMSENSEWIQLHKHEEREGECDGG